MIAECDHESPRNPRGHWIPGALLEAFNDARTTAHRLCSSDDAWLERFGDDLLLSYKHEAARETVLAALPEWSAAHRLGYRRIFGKHLPRRNDERAAPVLIEGDATLPLTTVVEENGMRFGLDFAAGYSAGLFIDQRENRTFVRRIAPRRMLNTFAYTCAFSVAGALAGAETVSVDLSRKSLDRGRENFALNGIGVGADGAHRFLADDVLDVLPRLARKGEKFDVIVLDPPTFSRGNKGRKFQVERDLEALFIAALEVAAPRARILLSTNCTRLTRRALETIARFGLRAARLGGDFHAEPAPPDIGAGLAAQTLWVTLR
jgi:23S rRNA (cytosine1962-C5)-methyltransferase